VWGGRCAGLIIILLTLVVYIPAMQGGFIWDDDSHCTEDRLVAAGDGWWRIWLYPQPRIVARPGGAVVWNYFPMSRTSFWIERRLWGLNPLGYHVVNVFLHGLNAVLLFSILRMLRLPGAWLAAAIFAVHPVNVETAAWVTQLKTLLSTFFFLCAVAAYLRYEDGRGTKCYVAGCVLFLCALLSKTATVMLPVVLILMRWYMGRRWAVRDFLKFAPFFALSAIMAAVSIIYERYFIGSSGHEWEPSFAQRVARAGMITWFYLAKILFPYGLSFNYPRWPVDASSAITYLPSVAVVVVGLVLWWGRRGWGRPLLLGLGYFFINLFPILGFFNIFGMRYAHVADHWQYLSCIGVMALAGGGLAALPGWLARADGATRAHVVRYATGASCFVILVLLGVLTWRQGYAYRDLETLWKHTLEREPRSWLANNNLGTILMARRDWDGAMHHFQQAVQAEPTYAETYVNMGNVVMLQREDWESAERYWRTATELDPKRPRAQYHLGVALARKGGIAEAIECWRWAVKIRPSDAQALQALGWGLALTGQTDEAISYLQLALELQPDLATARLELVNAYVSRRQFPEAVLQAREGLEQTPRHTALANRLAWLLATCPEPEVRDGAEALRLARQVCQWTGEKDPAVLDTLAAALAELGRFDEAVQIARNAVEQATALGRADLAQQISQRVERYQQARAYREP